MSVFNLIAEVVAVAVPAGLMAVVAIGSLPAGIGAGVALGMAGTVVLTRPKRSRGRPDHSAQWIAARKLVSVRKNVPAADAAAETVELPAGNPAL